jgi:hypothetical protein
VPADTDAATLPPPPPGTSATLLPPPVEVSAHQLTAVVAAAAAGTLLVYDRPPGVGWVIAATLVGGAVILGRRRAVDHPRADRWQRATGATALALATLPVLTDAGWVLGFALVAAAGLATLAVAAGTTWRSFVLPGLRTVPVAGAGLAAAGRRVGRVSSNAPTAFRHVRTGVITLLLLTVFGGLFASADVAFARLVELTVPDVSLEGVVARAAVGAVLGTVTLTLVLLRRVAADDRVRPPRRPLTGSEWLTPLTALVLLFSAFVVVQLGTLFGGDALVQRTVGLTYAGHAREGFAQLLTVAILTLAVIALVGRYAVPRSRREERTRRGLLAALCVLTLIVLASAFHRLSLYESAFGSTPARLTARATIVWVGGLFLLVLVAGATRRVTLLPRTAVLFTALALLGFGLIRPDAVVAAANVQRFAETGRLDVSLLGSLSADAAPALTELPPEVRACLADDGPDPGARRQDLLSWNLARASAPSLAAPPDVTCRAPRADAS